ncbi:efflux RND transporter permease subunit [Sphingomicrobium nitratireducens]|uniref:efflux RND transporter permease subunit n=1 Tax=Sphingomicrobium nitratireducens TaxID=2964666 RepID=UPI002240471F|nr:efflux RND transporter permease subunit [Sphingomicrobium nitratireducens]
MNFRNISAWCIRNPVPPIVLFVGLLLAGVVAFIRMDITNNPDIDFPAANVTVVQPSAAPSEIENQITQRVEAALRGIEGVDEINSSVREGSSNTFVQFEIGTPIDRAVNDVRDAISQVRSDLPDGILEPRVNQVSITDQNLSFVAAETTDMTLEELSWFVDNTVSQRMLGREGVAEVSRYGGVDREIRVILDPNALRSHGITAAQVNAQLRQTNINAAGGRTEVGGSEQTVRVLGNAQTAGALAETLVSVGNGRTVRLKDIAEVRDAASEQTSLARMNGQEVVVFTFNRSKGASDVTAYENGWDELNKIQEEDSRIRFVEINNSVDYTVSQYKSSMQALIEGALLAVLVVFLFLRDLRATLISAIAIPLSAIPAFFFMDLMDINLNTLSLLALALVAGVLVDDAIVEIENIVRHMRMGKSAYQASIDAADEIGLAVVATTSAIVAVFLPVALMPGISGQFFRHFGYTVVLAVIMSLLVARMISPLIAAYFLRAKGVQPHASGPAMQNYLKILVWTLRHRWAAVLAGFATFGLTIVLFATLPMQFQPELDMNTGTVRISMPPGATLEQTAAVAAEAADVVSQDPNVESVFQRVYTSSGWINVVFKDDRTLKSPEIQRGLAPKLAQIADARVNFQSQGGGGPGGSGQALTFYLGSSDPKLLEETAYKIAADMEKIPELVAPRVVGDDIRPEVVITPRLDLAADLGVTTAALSQTIRIATIGDIDQNSAKFSLSDRQIPIRVSLAEEQRSDLDTLMNLPVPTRTGGSVPLKSVADVSFGAGPTTIQRTDQLRRIAVGADLQPGVVQGVAWEKINALDSVKNLPTGVKRLNLGDQKWQAELVQNFIIAVFAGVLLVFAVLVLLYRRFLAPFVNMGSLLLAPLGAAIALHLSGQPISMPVFIGLLMLLGIVAKNSILLVDFALEMMNDGMDKDEAIYEAGHKRAQPIVMTTVAMVAGMIPIALSLHGDGSWRVPMGYTVIGGLIFSTALTLLLVPAYFSLAIDVEHWVARKFGRLVNNDKHPLIPEHAPHDDRDDGPRPLPAE